MSDSPPLPCLEHGEGEGICWGIDGISAPEFEKRETEEISKMVDG